jgi:YfiH family protein
VRALVTMRGGGVSLPPWDSLNLADHVGDDSAAVAENRRRLRVQLALPDEPVWLQQVHGCSVVDADEGAAGCRADAAVAAQPGRVCGVLTADCLPVVFCDRAATVVGVAHAGWRGLAAGVLEQTVARLGRPARELLAWLGPAISPQAFEVGDEVRSAFVTHDPQAAACFLPSPRGRWLADLYGLARLRMQQAGVAAIHGGGLCTFSDAARFYSYRRDGVTGRLASLVWLEPDAG